MQPVFLMSQRTYDRVTIPLCHSIDTEHAVRIDHGIRDAKRLDSEVESPRPSPERRPVADIGVQNRSTVTVVVR